MKSSNLDFDDICSRDFTEEVKTNIYNFNGL